MRATGRPEPSGLGIPGQVLQQVLSGAQLGCDSNVGLHVAAERGPQEPPAARAPCIWKALQAGPNTRSESALPVTVEGPKLNTVLPLNGQVLHREAGNRPFRRPRDAKKSILNEFKLILN